jgi:elongator complex protein 3
MYEDLIQEIKGARTQEEALKAKRRFSKRYGLARIPSNAEILDSVPEGEREVLRGILMKKPVRTLSGVAVVAVMARPHGCPGECIYCPRGEDAPQSYTGREPAALRAKRAGYDPFEQVHGRLRQLEATGHTIDKSELIVMGGTFLAQDLEYQEWFVGRCIQAMNVYPEIDAGQRTLTRIFEENEKAPVRNVGITFETRPDYSKKEHVDRMLSLGGTRVELGVQTLSDEVYRRVRRGHTLADVVKATRILKDSGLKVCYHMMPGLFSDPQTDLDMFHTLFDDPGFRPDMLKIYPTLVIKDTGLYDLWKAGQYTPYTDQEAVDLLVEVKRLLPKWVRTMRIQRDIPVQLVEAGIRRGDLGAMVYDRLKDEGERCRCIRCRDVGHLAYKEGVEVNPEDIHVLKEEYPASEGGEVFLSVEDTRADALIAYLRLRFPSDQAHRPEVDAETALVRELRVLGPTVPLGERLEGASQHGGWGGLLLGTAEEMAADRGLRKVLVTSAIGTRDYYRKYGYEGLGPYMGKGL